MTYHHLTHEGRLVQPSHDQSFNNYLARNRRRQIERYKLARYWPDRRTARMWALHYGKLLRMRGAL